MGADQNVSFDQVVGMPSRTVRQLLEKYKAAVSLRQALDARGTGGNLEAKTQLESLNRIMVTMHQDLQYTLQAKANGVLNTLMFYGKNVDFSGMATEDQIDRVHLNTPHNAAQFIANNASDIDRALLDAKIETPEPSVFSRISDFFRKAFDALIGRTTTPSELKEPSSGEVLNSIQQVSDLLAQVDELKKKSHALPLSTQHASMEKKVHENVRSISNDSSKTQDQQTLQELLPKPTMIHGAVAKEEPKKIVETLAKKVSDIEQEPENKVSSSSTKRLK